MVSHIVTIQMHIAIDGVKQNMVINCGTQMATGMMLNIGLLTWRIKAAGVMKKHGFTNQIHIL